MGFTVFSINQGLGLRNSGFRVGFRVWGFRIDSGLGFVGGFRVQGFGVF